jgi:cytochrome b
MVTALLAVMVPVGAIGWLCRTDWFFSSDWKEEAHEILANLMLGLHILGVVHASWRHRENLILSTKVCRTLMKAGARPCAF